MGKGTAHRKEPHAKMTTSDPASVTSSFSSTEHEELEQLDLEDMLSDIEQKLPVQARDAAYATRTLLFPPSPSKTCCICHSRFDTDEIVQASPCCQIECHRRCLAVS